MPGKDVVVVTGSDSNFFPYLKDMLSSLFDLGIDARADFGFIDLGLTNEHSESSVLSGVKKVKPEWTLKVPEEIRNDRDLGLVARTALRDYFPGYKVYIWFDADAWAQTPEFFTRLVDGANRTGAAIVRENGVGYKRNYAYRKWLYGNTIKCFGLLDGIRYAYRPTINIGILSLSEQAPHWDAWTRTYQVMIDKLGKINMDQHAFNVALKKYSLDATDIPALNNWLPTLSTPRWDVTKKVLCTPGKSNEPLSVVHLAGPDKLRKYKLMDLSGANIVSKLTYGGIKDLRVGC